MLKRKIEELLILWKSEKGKKAFLVKGARQVGKTTSIRNFGKSQYKTFIELNFERNPDLCNIFSGSLDARTIQLNMSAMGYGPFVPGETLIFFDEIQACPKARTAIKFLVEDGKFDFIESGSLLGINYNDVSSYPVGFENQHEMHSLDFEEFLWAKGVSEEVIHELRKCVSEKKELSNAIHQTMMRHFREFMIVGGMPSVVSRFIQSNDLTKVIKEQKDILNSYREDVKKYAGSNKTKVSEFFDSIPAQLNKKNKRFYLSALKKEPKMRTYEEAIMWLFDAKIASPCYNIAAIELPLVLNEKRNLFKVYMNDTGLLTALSYLGIQSEILNGNIEINEGSIIENALADAFLKNGFLLHYYDRKKPTSMEIDFVIQVRDTIQVIEAKSGSDFAKHDSLNTLLKEKNIGEPIVFCTENIHEANGILYLPYYLGFAISDDYPKQV